MTDHAGICLDDGQVMEVEPGTPWRRIESGRLDLFILLRDDDGTDMGRHLLFTLQPGDLLVAVAPGRDRLMAVARDAVVLGAAVNPSDPKPETAAGLDRWCEGMLEGLAELEVWRQDVPLRIGGGESARLEGGRRIRGRLGVVWLRLNEGPPPRLGRMALDPEILRAGFPISRRTGLTATGGSSFAAVETADLLRQPGAPALVCEFSAGIVALRGELIRESHGQRALQVQERVDTAHRAFARSIAGFGAVLHNRYAQPSAATLPPLEQAVAEVARYYGHDTARHASTQDGDLSGQAVERAARATRLRPCQVTLPARWWRQDLGPILAFAGEERRPIALIPRTMGGYLWFGPANDGAPRNLNAEDAREIEHAAYSLFPVFPEGPMRIRDFLAFGLRHCKREGVESLVIAALAGILTMATPILSAYVINTVVPDGDGRLLAQLAAGLVCVAVALFAIRLSGEVASLRIDGRVGAMVRAALIDRIIRSPAREIATVSTSVAAMQLSRLETFRRAILRLITTSITALLFSLFSLGVILYFAPMAALIAIVLILVLLAAVTWLGHRRFAALYEGARIDGNVSAGLFEAISNIAVLRAFGAEMAAFSNWAGNFLAFRQRMLRSGKLAYLSNVLTGSYDIVITALAFAVVGVMHGDEVSTGGFLAFVGALGTVVGVGIEMARSIQGVYAVMPIARIARPLLDSTPTPLPYPGPQRPPSGAIEVANVRFRYQPDGPCVLDGVDLVIQPQEFTAVVGPSGSGKSTLLRLILGLETPESGGIYFDGEDLSKIDPISLRRRMGTVLQGAGLFPGSILDNIRGGAEVPLAGVWEAAEQAAVADDIRAMPMGLHTVISGPDGGLSGGQAQRVLIARALAANPRILLFDEGTSALDNLRQAQIDRTLADLALTRIVIAHRLATVRDCDRIHVMDQGRIVQSGTYDELAAQPGLFAQLLAASD